MVLPLQSDNARNGDSYCSQDPKGNLSSKTTQRPNGDMISNFPPESAHLQPQKKSLTANMTPSAIYSTDRPAQKDILLGRGKPYQNHQGNVIMRRLARLYKDRYSQVHRDERRDVAMELVDRLLSTGAHFLKRAVRMTGCQSTSDGRGAMETWDEVSMIEACEKVCHALRAGPKATKTAHKNQTDSTSKTAFSDVSCIREVSKDKASFEHSKRKDTTVTLNLPVVTTPARAGLASWPASVFAGTSLSGLGSLPSTLATPTHHRPFILPGTTIRMALTDRLEPSLLHGSPTSSIFSSTRRGIDSSGVSFRGMNLRPNHVQPILPPAYMDPAILIALAEYLQPKSG
jgi:hypothetical protein